MHWEAPTSEVAEGGSVFRCLGMWASASFGVLEQLARGLLALGDVGRYQCDGDGNVINDRDDVGGVRVLLNAERWVTNCDEHGGKPRDR